MDKSVGTVRLTNRVVQSGRAALLRRRVPIYEPRWRRGYRMVRKPDNP